jgi:hypothetical protein
MNELNEVPSPVLGSRHKNRTKYVAACIVAGLSVVGCARSAEGQKPTPAQLSDALLTITDLDGGWSESQRQFFDTRSPENPSIDPSIWCPESAEVTKNLVDLAGDAGADVEMSIETDSGGPRIMRLQAWANDDVRDYFKDASEAARLCDGVTNTDDSGATSTTALIIGRDIGDESISWSDTIIPPPGTEKDKRQVVGRTTIARFGDIIMVLQLGDVGPVGSTELMNEDDWWSVVETAGKKLDTLDEQVHD